MAKIKFTKGELKKERDALRQYRRYLPTLQLKKQQLQLEILRQMNWLEEKKHSEEKKIKDILSWAGLLREEGLDLKPFLRPLAIRQSLRNIAGIDIPVFETAEFARVEYDLFSAPLWVDIAIEKLQSLIALKKEMEIIEEGIRVLKAELRLTTQRVNLFEKVKIPEAEVAIRLIKIYIGDQMANAVGRSKIAKRKIEAGELEEVPA